MGPKRRGGQRVPLSMNHNQYELLREHVDPHPKTMYKAITDTLYLVWDICLGGLYILKPMFKLAAALMIAYLLFQAVSSTVKDHLFDILCPNGLFKSIIPFCRDHKPSIPDFTHFVQLQESLYDNMLSKDNAGAIDVMELKRAELATRDLRPLIKHSKLVSKDILVSKLDEYNERSRLFSRDIHGLQAQTKGVVDNLITYNTFTLKSLTDLKNNKASRQELTKLYERAMTLVEDEAKRLILTIERVIKNLDVLQEDLYSLHEMSVQENVHQRAEMPVGWDHFLDVVVGANSRVSLVASNLDILNNFDKERALASRQLMYMLARMESFQMDLTEMRAQVVSPILEPDSVSLEFHIQNIAKAIERLKSGKVISFEERARLDPAQAIHKTK
ncbi:hypothetical protein BDB01DRAFT_896469 [Pilobolus umbonatus]|nr:hypothetical protein BDB01DRAFT_896469 [Pilobolus umbonatus]